MKGGEKLEMEAVEIPILVKSEVLKQYVAALCVSLGGVCVGMVLTWTSPVSPQLLQNNFITPNQEGIIGSMLALGALISAVPSGYLADRIGRKKALLSFVVPFILSWILIVPANSAAMIIAGRFFAGFASGGMCVCAPMYLGEMSHASIRGILGSFWHMSFCTGALLTAILGACFDWRWFSVISSAFPVIFFVAMYFMPESPVYLMQIEKVHEAKRVLKYFRGTNYPNIEDELNEMKKMIEEAKEGKMKLRDLISSKVNRRAAVSVFGIVIFQQFTGIDAMLFYTETIFRSAGSSLSADLATIVFDLMQLIAAVVAIFVIERANRKFYLNISAVGMAVCLGALGAYFQFLKLETNRWGFLPLLSLVTYIAAFSIGFGPVPWMIISELFAPEAKALGTGLAVVLSWSFMFMVTLTFPLMTTYLGNHVTFYIFSLATIVGMLFVQYFIPETRGKTLQEIQELLGK